MSRRGLAAQAALLAILALAACGGASDDAQGDGGISEADVEDAGLEYARCMRERGIDVPDPRPGVGGVRGMLMDADSRNDRGFPEAERECRKYLQDLVGEIDEDLRREFEEARLEFARCMRDEGFDVHDSRSGAGPPAGGSSGEGSVLGDLNPDDPRVQEAMEACSEQGPRLRLGQ
jgi:hypothetical protein